MAAQERVSSARLRRDFAEVQRDFADAEDFLYSLGAPKFALVLNVAPRTGEVTTGGEAGNSGEIVQLLPVSSRAMGSVDLEFTRVPSGDTGHVELNIIDLNGAVLGSAPRR